MHAPDNQDPWSSLAESLGVGPGSEPERKPAAPPPARTPPRPAEKPKPRASGSSGNWDDLAADLGIAPAAPAAPRTAEPPRPAERRPPRDTTAGDEAGRERRPPPADAGRAARDDFRDDVPTGEPGPATRRDDDGEGRGRRRRGRRGGRSRRGGEGTIRTDEAASSRDRDEFASRLDNRDGPDDERAPRGEERDGEPSSTTGQGGPGGEGDDDRPRRRRRRGRRGGRGRSRTREGGEPLAEGRERASQGAEAFDDEPLPTSYGMRAPARAAEGRDQAGDGERSRQAAGEGSGAGSPRGRRRRRRRGGDERQGQAASGRSSGESDRGRRSRRGRDERGGSSRSSRVRRADFAPVSSAYDEDDEGLEFLGVEEASREAGRRPAHAVTDEVIAESGLDAVRDVPSWVEAIGIVIAGNLDARNRGRGEGGRHRDR